MKFPSSPSASSSAAFSAGIAGPGPVQAPAAAAMTKASSGSAAAAKDAPGAKVAPAATAAPTSPATAAASSKDPGKRKNVLKDPQTWEASLPVEKCCPQIFQVLQVLHLDHLMTLKGPLQLVCTYCVILPLSHSLRWIFKITQLECVKTAFSTCGNPWDNKTMLWLTCFIQIFGLACFLPGAWGAIQALMNCDESKDLKKRLTANMDDLRIQCDEVVTRTEESIHNLCDRLSDQLQEDINVTVEDMQAILGRADEDSKDVYERLLISFAKILVDVRWPATVHLDKVISFASSRNACQAKALADVLKASNDESMVALLAPKLSRQEQDRLEEKVDPHHALGATAQKNKAQNRQKKAAMASTVSLPSNNQMTSLLKALAPKPTEYGKRVLFPVVLVMKWVTLFSATKPGGSHDSIELATAESQRFGKKYFSGMSRLLICGLVGSIFFLGLNIHQFITMIEAWSGQQCQGFNITCILSTTGAAGSICSMLLYTIGLCFVLSKLSLIDDVIAERQELANLREFKHTFDDLNSHFLACTDEDNKMIKEVQDHLNKPSSAVSAFLRLRDATSKDFQDLAAQLEKFHAIYAKQTGSWDSAQQRQKAANIAANQKNSADTGLHDDDRMEAGWCGCARTLCSRQSRTTSHSYSRTPADDHDPNTRATGMPARQPDSSPQKGYSPTPQSDMKPLLSSLRFGMAAPTTSPTTHTVE